MKVIFSQLELMDDQYYWYNGERFNGIAVYRRDDGTLESEVTFVDGMQTGSFMDYHSNGIIACQGTIKNEVYHGDLKYWDSDGMLTKTETYELNICTSRKEYDQAGQLISEYSLAAQNRNAALLAAFRRHEIS